MHRPTVNMRKIPTSIFFSVFACLLFLNSVFVPVQAQSQTEPKYGGTLIIATGSGWETPTLNPALYGIVGESSKIFSSLIQHDLDLNPQPDLAESWAISEDGKTYTFHLVRNATFHDGKPVTSADVKFTIEEVVIPYDPLGKVVWKDLESIETPDNYTVVFKLKQPFSALIFMLDMGSGGPPVLPKHLYEGTDIPNNPYNQKPIGSGTFKFVKWEKGNQLILERNENYFRKGLPYLDRVIIKTMPDTTSIALAIESGEVNYAPAGISFADVKRLRDLDNVEVSFAGQEGNGETLSLVVNLDHLILGNQKVRQALAHAVDKDMIIDRIYIEEQKAAVMPVSSSVRWAFNPDVQKYEHSAEEANRLLDEAGYPKGPDGKRFAIELSNIAGIQDRLKVTEIVREQLREVGIEVTVVSLELAAYDDVVIRNRDFDLALEGWSSGPDPSVQLAQLFHSKQAGVFLGNGANYKNERVDELLDAAAVESDREKKAQMLYEVQDHLARDLPFISLVELTLPSAYTTDFVGLPSSPWVPTEPMEKVWWTGGTGSGIDQAPESSESESIANGSSLVALVIIAGIVITTVVGIIAVYARRRSKANRPREGTS